MKLLASLLPLVLVLGCHTAPSNSRPMPPLPPGFKPGQTRPARQVVPPKPPGISSSAPRVAAFAPASAVPTVTPGTGILQAPEMYTDPDPQWGRLFLARAYQGPNTELVVEYAHDPAGPWNLVTRWDCWPTEQIILVTTSGNFPRLYMRGRHVSCPGPSFAPASAARLGFTKDFKLRSGKVKAAKIEGHEVAPAFALWKVLP